jgi:hypothetical protein
VGGLFWLAWTVPVGLIWQFLLYEHVLRIPRARYSSIYLSTNRSHRLIVVLPNEKGGPLARSALNVIELNDMTPDMIASGVGMGPELN